MRKIYKSKDVELELRDNLLKIRKYDKEIELTMSEAIGTIVLMQEIIRNRNIKINIFFFKFNFFLLIHELVSFYT